MVFKNFIDNPCEFLFFSIFISSHISFSNIQNFNPWLIMINTTTVIPDKEFSSKRIGID
jgi:hypothetical protein